MHATQACCPAIVLPTQLPLRARLSSHFWLDVQAAVASWRAAAHQRQCLRALQGLSDATLRDIGMAERLPPRPQTLGLLDCERGRWS